MDYLTMSKNFAKKLQKKDLIEKIDMKILMSNCFVMRKPCCAISTTYL